MTNISTPISDLPPEQRAIRAKCFHPTGRFVEFKKEEIEQSIPERFEKTVRMYSDRIAVKTKGRALTYDELNKTANRVARTVLSLIGPPEQPVTLLMDSDTTLFSTILGVLKSRKFYVPLDPTHPKARCSYIQADSQSRVLLTDSKNLSLAKELATDGVRLVNVGNLESGIPDDNLGLAISPDCLAYIIYTSGTTGQPKGVVQNHRNILNKVREYTNSWGIAPADRLVLLYSPSASGAVRDIFSSLLNGASLFPFSIRGDGITDLPRWLIDEQITIYNSAASLFRQFVSLLTGEEKFSNLFLIHVGSETIYRDDVEQYKKYFSDNCIFVARYGTSEISSIRQFAVDKNTSFSGGTVPAGYEVEDTEVLLLNDEGEEIGVNQVGEIAVRSRYLTPGYWRRPDLTEAAFVPTPNGEDERIYRTGDLGRMLPDGCLLHMGRKDFQVKVRGHRVEVAEIEISLLNLRTIKEAVVRVREDRPGEQRLEAYLVPEHLSALTVTTLRHLLAETLPDYMIPSVFVMLNALPLTPNGKVDRLALPAPSSTRPELDTRFTAPRTPIEEKLAQVWAEVLSLDQVGIHDNFMELGGDSLAATRVISRVIDIFRVEPPLRSLFEAATVANMAIVITENQAKRVGQEELARVLAELESLSDEEARKRLADEDAKEDSEK